jgi:hypothetical protein
VCRCVRPCGVRVPVEGLVTGKEPGASRSSPLTRHLVIVRTSVSVETAIFAAYKCLKPQRIVQVSETAVYKCEGLGAQGVTGWLRIQSTGGESQNHSKINTGMRKKTVSRGGPRSLLHLPSEFYVGILLHKMPTQPVTGREGPHWICRLLLLL